MTKTSEKRATQQEQEILRDELLERGFSMAQVRRAVRALTPHALSFTKEQFFSSRTYAGPHTPFATSAAMEQRARDRGTTYEGDQPDDVPFPNKVR